MFLAVTIKTKRVHYYDDNQEYDFIFKSYCGLAQDRGDILRVGEKTKRSICVNCMRVRDAKSKNEKR